MKKNNNINISKVYSNEILDIEKEMNDIYINREKYKLKYAYKYSYNRISDFLDTHIFNEIEEKVKENVEDSEKILRKMRFINKIIARKSNNYKEINFIITFIEMIFSAFLILGVHNVTEVFIHNYQEYINVSIIVFIFGLFKFFIEDRIIRPMLYKHGWNVYRDNIQVVKENMGYVNGLFTIFKNSYEKQENKNNKEILKETNIKEEKIIDSDTTEKE